MGASATTASRIVAGIDGGAAGEDAAVLASVLAEPEQAELVLAGVWPDVPLPVPVVLGEADQPQRATERMLLDVRKRFAPRGVTKVLSDRSVARALRRLTEQQRVELLVLGSAAKATRGHARAGRDARQIVHDARCPVALAARDLRRRPFALGRIVVAIDGGPEADMAMGQALALARAHGSHVTAATVIDDAPPPVSSPLADGLDMLQWEEMVAHQRRRAELLSAAAVEHQGVDAVQLRTGDPAAELSAAAVDADLLIVGSRHWGPIERVVIGSVAEDLLDDTPCSLMLVPRDGAASGHGTRT
jgi:nucleotide-binding universal stress UspA family protein